MSLWTSEQAAKATGGKVTSAWEATSVSIDSRTIQKGGLFIALKGENFDGHEYVQKALENGAAAAVVSTIPAGVAKDAPLLVVKDTEQALTDLGIFRRKENNALIVGVTGSVGKTSVKEMLAIAFQSAGKTYATEGNLNNHLGAPLSLARMETDTKYGIIEMGMNHSGEISRLTRIVEPDIAIITTIAPAHLEFFPSLDGIADAKAEIFEGVRAKGSAILNHDNQYFNYLSDKAKKAKVGTIVSFGEAASSTCRLLKYEQGKVTASLAGKEVSYRLQVPGKHQALNSLAVLAACIEAKIDIPNAINALEQYAAQAGRGKRFVVQSAKGAFTLIDDCYNASPASMCAAFAAMENTGRKIAILGDMLEMGDTSPSLHAGLAKDIVANNIDAVYTAGPMMKHLHDTLPSEKRAGHFASAAEMVATICAAIEANDVVLVKGSNGMKMKQIVEALKQLEQQHQKVVG